eukprot:scaffold95581_cov33-Tisochrysis_lutea.AAC.4
MAALWWWWWWSWDPCIEPSIESISELAKVMRPGFCRSFISSCSASSATHSTQSSSGQSSAGIAVGAKERTQPPLDEVRDGCVFRLLVRVGAVYAPAVGRAIPTEEALRHTLDPVLWAHLVERDVVPLEVPRCGKVGVNGMGEEPCDNEAGRHGDHVVDERTHHYELCRKHREERNDVHLAHVKHT